MRPIFREFMSHTATLERQQIDAAPARNVPVRTRDDAAMLKAAANLTRDLNVPDARIYWADLIGSAALGYAGLLTAMFAESTLLAIAANARKHGRERSSQSFEAESAQMREHAHVIRQILLEQRKPPADN